MQIRTYQVWETVIRFAVCGIVIASVILGYWIPLVIGIVAAITAFIVMRLRVKGVVEDERTNAVTQKSTYFSFTFGTFITAVTGAVLVFTNRGDMSSVPAVIGFTLFFTSMGFSLLRDIAYYVNSRRLSGKSE